MIQIHNIFTPIYTNYYQFEPNYKTKCLIGAGICHTGLWGFSEALQQWVSHSMMNPIFRIYSFMYKKFLLAQYSVLNSMYRSGLVDMLVTHASVKGLGLIPSFRDHSGLMPPQLKTKQDSYKPSYLCYLFSCK